MALFSKETGKSRLELVKEGLASGLGKRGRHIVSLDRLLEDPHNERKTFRNMDGLVASLKAVGLVEPITVTQQGDRYRILTGHRRARAAKLAGLREVEVLIREGEDELLRRRKSLISNVQREDLGAVDLAEALQAMLDEDNQITSQRELARVLGKREAWVSDMLRVLSLPIALQTRLRHSEISVPYDTIIRIARITDEDEQKRLAELALSGLSNTELRRSIGELKNNKVTRRKRTERVSVMVEGYTASVVGPAGDNVSQHMKAAVESLLEKLADLSSAA
jgi:ParB/RepB/Spo0J family partition protein